MELDFAPLCAVAKMLYETSFVAERYAGIRPFLESETSGVTGPGVVDVSTDSRMLPVTRAIINGAGNDPKAFSSMNLFFNILINFFLGYFDPIYF